MCRTRQNWNSVWQGSFWQPHFPQDQPAPPGWCRIDPRLGVATTWTPILKPSSNFSLAIASITGSATSPSYYMYLWILTYADPGWKNNSRNEIAKLAILISSTCTCVCIKVGSSLAVRRLRTCHLYGNSPIPHDGLEIDCTVDIWKFMGKFEAD